jgi:hypothetical protein
MMMNLDQSILGYKMDPYAGISEARILPRSQVPRNNEFNGNNSTTPFCFFIIK